MGVLRLMGTLLKHPATTDALMENVPVFECLAIDYNANIHYILQRVVTELNEILYFVYCQENSLKNIFVPGRLPLSARSTDINDSYNLNLEISAEDLEDKLDRFNEDYQIGTTYAELHRNLSDEEKMTDIIFRETINYTRQLICSLNKGWIKKVFLSLDGTPSMAKIKEQRNRRYIGAHINNIKEDIVKKYKFKNHNIYQIDLFYYRSMICAGTQFMEKIQQALFNLDIDLDIDVSTLNIKGEGEKKIIHALEEYLDHDSFCIMSPDSDMLILIGILSNNAKFDGKKLYNFRIDYQRKNQYQFFDLRQLIENFQKYYSARIGKEISLDKMLDLFFMLVAFGNDFLPRLEPLDITQHFDFVCETCLKISTADTHFIRNGGQLNYQYLLQFFKIINNDIINLSTEQALNAKYSNYYKLCKQISLTEEDLKSTHHPSLKLTAINYYNFGTYLKILNTAYSKLITFLGKTIIKQSDIKALYKEIHTDPNDSYLLLVLPRLLRFPGGDTAAKDNYSFFEELVEFTNSSRDLKSLKFRTRLMPREFIMNNASSSDHSTTAYLHEIEKLNKSMEPYRTIFRMANINLVTFDITNGQLVDLRDKYYETYVKPNITKKEIKQMVIDYLCGIEWLYQYYISGQHLEWSGWQYNYTQPPLLDDVIKYLEDHPNCNEEMASLLSSYPENNMSPLEHYRYVTPNEYTKAGVSPNLSDVVDLIDGYGALYLNKCQIKWQEIN